jgi:hypothetical protein
VTHYYFDFVDDENWPDSLGIDLPSRAEARREAVAALAAIAADLMRAGEERTLCMNVREGARDGHVIKVCLTVTVEE